MWLDRVDRHTALGVVSGDEWQQDANSVIEPLKDEEADEQDSNQDELQGLQVHGRGSFLIHALGARGFGNV